MPEASIDDLFKEMDKMSSEGVAEGWAITVSSQGISKESSRNGALIYTVYTSRQPEERKNKITERFNYLTSPQGALELDKLL